MNIVIVESPAKAKTVNKYLGPEYRVIASYGHARVSGLVRSGLFVRLMETGADGFVPASSIGREYFYHDEVRQALVGEDTGLGYRLGDSIEVRLVEAIPTAGALRFEMLSEGRSLGARPKGARSRSDRARPQGYKGKPKGRGPFKKRR